jgi:hypothetical protein
LLPLWQALQEYDSVTGGKLTVAIFNLPFKYEAQTALFKDPVRTAQ